MSVLRFPLGLHDPPCRFAAQTYPAAHVWSGLAPYSCGSLLTSRKGQWVPLSVWHLQENLSEIRQENDRLTLNQKLTRFSVHIAAWLVSTGVTAACCVAVYYLAEYNSEVTLRAGAERAGEDWEAAGQMQNRGLQLGPVASSSCTHKALLQTVEPILSSCPDLHLGVPVV